MSSRPSQRYRLRVKKVGRENDPKAPELTFSPKAFHSQTLPFMATRIGTFRMDLGMALDQPGIKPFLSLKLIYMNK